MSAKVIEKNTFVRLEYIQSYKFYRCYFYNYAYVIISVQA